MLQKLVKATTQGAGLASAARVSSGLSVIGPDVRIVGDIITKGEMQIDGQVDGDIECQTLVVGEGARIGGAVTAETVKVHGELNGKIIADTVMIAKSAVVVGDITHASLEIEAGAQIEGHIARKGGTVKLAAADAKIEKKGNGALHPQHPALKLSDPETTTTSAAN